MDDVRVGGEVLVVAYPRDSRESDRQRGVLLRICVVRKRSIQTTRARHTDTFHMRARRCEREGALTGEALACHLPDGSLLGVRYNEIGHMESVMRQLILGFHCNANDNS